MAVKAHNKTTEAWSDVLGGDTVRVAASRHGVKQNTLKKFAINRGGVMSARAEQKMLERVDSIQEAKSKRLCRHCNKPLPPQRRFWCVKCHRKISEAEYGCA